MVKPANFTLICSKQQPELPDFVVSHSTTAASLVSRGRPEDNFYDVIKGARAFTDNDKAKAAGYEYCRYNTSVPVKGHPFGEDKAERAINKIFGADHFEAMERAKLKAMQKEK